MKGISAFVVASALIGSMGIAGRAEAACDAAQTVADGRTKTFTSIHNGTNDIGIFFQARAGRSYSIESYISSKGYLSGSLSNNVNTSFCAVSDMAGLTNTAAIDPAPQASFPNLFYRVSLTAPVAQLVFLRTGNTTAVAMDISIKITETTLFSPAWSTNGSYDTFYSFQNTTNATCTGEITLYNQAGTQVANAALTVPPAGTAATNTATLGVPDASTGTARFTHNCPPSAFLATAAIANFSSTPAYNQFIPFLAPRE